MGVFCVRSRADRCSFHTLSFGLQIDTARGKETAKEYGMKFFETSAKNDTNVSKAFHAIIKDIVERQVAQGAGAPGSGSNKSSTGASGAGQGAAASGRVPVNAANSKPRPQNPETAAGKKCVIM